MRKLAKLAALAVAAVMSISMAFAGEVSFPSTMVESDTYGEFVDVVKFVDDATKVDTIKVTFTADESGDPEKPIKGCFSIGAESNGWWSQSEYLVTDDACTTNDDGSFTYLYKLDAPLAATDTLAKFGAQIWDGDNMVMSKIEFLDASGNVLTKSDAPAETPAETPDEKPDDESPKTGDATSVIVLGGVALLALAGVALTKKNA